jgi:ABC-type sulfate transport system permease component
LELLEGLIEIALVRSSASLVRVADRYDEAFRLRRVGERNYMTYKGPKLDATTKSRPEEEVRLADGAAALAACDEIVQRSGPLGDLKLIYTPWAIIIAQTVISAPVVTGLTAAALAALDPRLQQQLLGLGASRVQMIWMLWREARLPLLAALMAGFGSVISEVGASMMVGGNIRGQTRVLTTAIVLETGKGEFENALALSALLLVITYLINLALTWIQQKGQKR